MIKIETVESVGIYNNGIMVTSINKEGENVVDVMIGGDFRERWKCHRLFDCAVDDLPNQHNYEDDLSIANSATREYTKQLEDDIEKLDRQRVGLNNRISELEAIIENKNDEVAGLKKNNNRLLSKLEAEQKDAAGVCA
jgi:uncharacterized protein YdiU (UPF0061 family)